MLNRKWALAAVAAVLLTGLGGSGNQAWGGSRLNVLTFSGAVALPGVVLPAGSYTFEVLPSGGSYEVVQVRSRAGHGYFMGFTQAVERRGARRGSTITFGEAPAGTPPPIAAWYPDGANRGHRFIYPESR